jgi:hypothetical protein
MMAARIEPGLPAPFARVVMEPYADKRQECVVSAVSKATSSERRERAFVRDRIGKDHLDDIRRFEMLKGTRSTSSPNVGANTVIVMPRTGLSQVIL